MAEQHEKALVPQIRFTGFTDPWEQRKLGEELGFLRNNTLSRAELSDSEGTVFDIHYGDVLIKYGSVLDAEKVDVPRIANDAVANRQTCDCLQDGDVIIADTAEDSAVGKCTELCNSAGKKVFSGLHTMPLRPMRKYASGYLGHYLNSPAFHDQLLPLMQGIKVISVSRSAIEDMTMSVPSVAEQASIGAFFDRLDSLITLHQRKYDKLCVLKKSMLDKMFPKGGSLYPEIRFAGFTDPWEQRKLSSTCEQLSRTINPLETPNEEFTEYSMPAFDNNETAETVIGNSMNSLRKIVDRPCLLVNKLNVRKKRIWHVPRPEANAVCSSEFVPFSSHSSDLSFIKISLLSERITAYLESCSSGSSNSQKRVTPEIIMSSEIIAPSLAEQRRIGAFFDRLDSLITLHQRKLELLRNIKKSMLDKMFV
ncbi:restriction endonuclease subunit S [Bifidobacterium adolescentis]|nr:restriction endonuclease subunit S [Bifidobacterium adolescentis]